MFTLDNFCKPHFTIRKYKQNKTTGDRCNLEQIIFGTDGKVTAFDNKFAELKLTNN